MKKHKKFSLLNNATVALLIVSTCLFLFTGCQGKSSTNQKVSANSNTNSNQRSKGKLNADDMKKKMQENITSLVTDGTINQSQGDKILEALTANTQRFNGGGKSQNNQQNNPNNTQGNAQNTPQNNSNNTQGNKQNMQKIVL